MHLGLLCFILSPWGAFSQSLLANGGFEDENVCTEYEKHCAPEAWIPNRNNMDYYFISPAFAYEGTHCVAVEAGHARGAVDRTFFTSQLLCKLRKGNTYKIEFYLKSRFNLLDSVGVYFTPTDFLLQHEPPLSLTPSFYVADAGKMPEENDTGWQKVSFNYKANGQEIYITLGNFSRGNMPAKLRKTPDRHVLIFIDNISISPADPSESICPDWQERKNEIYAFNARHFYLEDYINFKSRQAPNPPQLSKTTVVKIDTLIIPDILFETGKSTLTQKSNAFLDSVSIELYAKKIDSMVVEGHTDSIGSLASNQKLSYDRANTVADYFKAKLVSATYITRGWASAKPVAANTTPAGRQKNRRVEIYLYVRD